MPISTETLKQWIASGSIDGSVRIWEVETDLEVITLVKVEHQAWEYSYLAMASTRFLF